MPRTFTRIIVPAVVGFLLVGLAAVGVAGLLDIKLPFQTRTVDRSQPVLLKSIEELSQYHAAVGNFEVVLDAEQDVDFLPDFVAGERSLFVAAGTVDAYVDFAGLAHGDLTVSKDGKSATIRLPKAKLAKPNLDQKRTYLFSKERGVLNRLGDAMSTDSQQALYVKAEDKLAAAAKESGLTEQADKNTRAILTGMFQAMGMTLTFIEPGDE